MLKKNECMGRQNPEKRSTAETEKCEKLKVVSKCHAARPDDGINQTTESPSLILHLLNSVHTVNCAKT